METSLDQLSTRLQALQAKVAALNISAMTSLSGSESGGLNVPSLTTSNTLSSELFTELETETDLDGNNANSSVLMEHEPLLGSARDLVHELTGALEGLTLRSPSDDKASEIKLGTPGHFPGKAGGETGEDGYEGGSDGEGGKGGWGLSAKRRTGSLKRRKTAPMILSRPSHADYMLVDTIGSPECNVEANGTPDTLLKNSEEDRELTTPSNTPILDDSDTLTFPLFSVTELEIKAQEYTGLSSAWHDEATPRIPGSYEDSPHPLSNQEEDMTGNEEPTLQPMDSVLMFVTTPSPMEDLPGPLLSLSPSDFRLGDAREMMESELQPMMGGTRVVEGVQLREVDLFANAFPSSSGSGGKIGLGIDFGFGSAGANFSSSFAAGASSSASFSLSS